MTKIQLWFIIIAGLLGIGIPLLFLGLELPNALHAAILNEAAQYVILDEEDFDFWSRLPGRTGMIDMKSYYIFECQNHEEVATRAAKPQFKEEGPFNFTYSHSLDKRIYSDDDGVKNSRVSYVRKYIHTYHGDPKNLRKKYWAVNMAGLKRWFNVKNKERFQLAIEGFYELFSYTKINFIRDTIIKTIISYYHEISHINDLTKDIGVNSHVTRALIYDHYYGLLQEENIYEWSTMCDSFDPYIEHEILYYFGFNYTQFEIVKERFCKIYNAEWKKSRENLCELISDCSRYNISYNQWHYKKMLGKNEYKDITHKTIFGCFEYASFEKDIFFKKLNPKYKNQFSQVKWDDKSYHYLLNTWVDSLGFGTDSRSLLLFENMRRLFEAGMNTPSPYTIESRGAVVICYIAYADDLVIFCENVKQI